MDDETEARAVRDAAAPFVSAVTLAVINAGARARLLTLMGRRKAAGRPVYF